MAWDKIGYAALCVVVPVAWGLLIYGASSLIEKRVLSRRPTGLKDETHPDGADETTLPLDYHI